MQENCSQEHQWVGAIQRRSSVEVRRCRNRTTLFIWLSQNKYPVNKGQPEHVWGRAGRRVILFCGARISFNPDWEKAEFLTSLCGYRQWVRIAIEICKTQSNPLPHSEQSCCFLFSQVTPSQAEHAFHRPMFVPFSVVSVYLWENIPI